MEIDLTTIIVAGIGGTGLAAQFLKFKYDMKKLSLESKDKEIDVMNRAKEEQRENCDAQHERVLNELKEHFNQSKEIADKRSAKRRSMIYAALHELRINLHLDRAYILQPHPRNKHEFLSVIFEVDENGVEMAMDIMEGIKIKDYKLTVKTLAEQEFIDITPAKITDKNTKSIFLQSGALRVFACRLLDEDGEWVGSLVGEYTDEGKLSKVQPEYVRLLFEQESIKIKNIIPDIL